VKNQFIQSQKQFQEMKKRIEERVEARPLLVEQGIRTLNFYKINRN